MTRVLLAVLALACIASPALADAVAPAAGNTAVVLPWGDLLIEALQGIALVAVPVLASVIGLAIRQVAPWAALFLSQQRIEGMVKNVTDYGLNAVEGAVKGETLTVPLGSAVVAQAVQRALDAAPAKVVDAAGGPAGIAERVFRTLKLDQNATAESVLGPVFAQIRAGAAQAKLAK